MTTAAERGLITQTALDDSSSRPGRDGRDGTSVTVEAEAPGANCAAGGAKLTAANGVAHVCNALPPDPGLDY